MEPAAVIEQKVPGADEHEGGRQRPVGRAVLEQAADHAALAVAEGRLAEAREDLLDRAARGALDLVVGVDEVEAEALREAPPDRGLARAHQPDEHDAATFRQEVGEGRRRLLAHGWGLEFVIFPL